MNLRMGMWSSLLLSTAVTAGALQMDDFAYGIPLQVDGDGAIYSLPVPDEVYRRSWDGSLTDLRVFNSHGEAVPHTLQRMARSRDMAAQKVIAALYPLPTQQNRPPRLDELHIELGTDGTIVDFYGGRLPLAGAGADEYYLIDASQLETPIERMRLYWPAQAESLLTQVSLQGSDDLNHWTPLLQKQTIAALQHQGYSLVQHTLNLDARPMKYYRLHWPPGSKEVALQRVELVLRAGQEALPEERATLFPRGTPAEPGDYRFDLGGYFPVQRLQLTMPQRNSVVRARLFSRANEEAPWQLRHSGLFYDLELDGHRLRNEPLALPPLPHGQWRLEIEQNGGGLGSGTPQLELGWLPQRLVFIARGEMPFTLAFGRYGAEAEQPLLDPLLASLDSNVKPNGMIKPAAPGAVFELGGAARLSPTPPPLPWQKWLLWGVLILGVMVLGVMVRSLYRQMKGAEDLG